MVVEFTGSSIWKNHMVPRGLVCIVFLSFFGMKNTIVQQSVINQINLLLLHNIQTKMPAISSPDFEWELSNFPNSSAMNRAIARFELLGGRPQKSVEYLENAISQDINDPLVILYLAQAYEAIGDRSRAESAWRKSGGGQYLSFQGKQLIADGNIEFGLNRLKLAADIAPTNVEVLYSAGDAFWSHGKNLDEAIKYYYRAIELDTDSASFRRYFAAGRIYFVRKEWGLAIPQFELAIRYSDKLGAPYYWLGRAWLSANNDVVKATQAFEQCIIVESGYHGCYLELANIFQGQGRTEEARKLLEMSK